VAPTFHPSPLTLCSLPSSVCMVAMPWLAIRAACGHPPRGIPRELDVIEHRFGWPHGSAAKWPHLQFCGTVVCADLEQREPDFSP
jgi:hypothetical protein